MREEELGASKTEIKDMQKRSKFIESLEYQVSDLIFDIAINFDSNEYNKEMVTDIVLARERGEYKLESLKKIFPKGPQKSGLQQGEISFIADYLTENPHYMGLIAKYLTEEDILKLVSYIPAEEIKEIIIAHIPNISSKGLCKVINDLENSSARLYLLSFFKDKIEYNDIMNLFRGFDYDDDKLEFYNIFSSKLKNEDVLKIVSTMEFDDRKEWLYYSWIENISDVLQSEGNIAEFIEYVGGYNRRIIIDNYKELKLKKMVEQLLIERTDFTDEKIDSILKSDEIITSEELVELLKVTSDNERKDVIRFFNGCIKFEELKEIINSYIENDEDKRTLLTEFLRFHISDAKDTEIKEVISWYYDMSDKTKVNDIIAFIRKASPNEKFFTNLQYIMDEEELDFLNNNYDKNNIILETINYKFINRMMRKALPQNVLSFLSKYPIQDEIVELIEENPKKLERLSSYVSALNEKYSYYEDITDMIVQSLKKDNANEQEKTDNIFQDMYDLIYQDEINLEKSNTVEYAFFKKFKLPLKKAQELIKIYGSDIKELIKSDSNPVLKHLEKMKTIIDNPNQSYEVIINLINNLEVEDISYEQLVCYEKELKLAYNNEYMESFSDIPQKAEEIKNSKIKDILKDSDVRTFGNEYKVITTMIGAFSGETLENTDPVQNWNRVSNTQNHCINTSYSTNNNNSTVRRFMPGKRKTIFGFDLKGHQENGKELIYQISPYDAYSNTQYDSVKMQRKPVYYTPNNMPTMCRYLYTDFILERGIQPDYVLVYDMNNSLNETDEFAEYITMQKKIADAFGIPIINIERTDVAKSEYDRIIEQINDFKDNPSPELVKNIIESFCNNRNGYISPYGNISEDIIGNKILNDYFSSEKFGQVIQLLYQSIESLNGKIEKRETELLIESVVSTIDAEIKKAQVIQDSYDKYYLFFDPKQELTKFIELYFGKKHFKKFDVLEKLFYSENIVQVSNEPGTSRLYRNYNRMRSELENDNTKQMNLDEVINLIKSSGKMYLLVDAIENIKLDKIYKSDLHGITHNQRVAISAFTIGILEGLEEDELKMLLEAAKYHDIGRDNDDEDREHGSKSADQIDDVVENMTAEEISILKTVCAAHSVSDEEFEKMTKKYNVQDVEKARKITDILKDADALDRVRLLRDEWESNVELDKRYGLNRDYLRTKSAKAMELYSYELFYNYTNKQKNIDKKKEDFEIEKV